MAGGVDFNRGKFKELVLYFVHESALVGDEGFGMVKLNKLLYRADFQAFRLLGRSMTGETYEKQEFGPVARDLPIVLDELAGHGRLYWQQLSRGPHVRKVPTGYPDDESRPDLTLFTVDETGLMKATLVELKPHGGRSASDWSHEQSAGWNLVPDYGRVIEYGTEFLSTDAIPREDLERAREFVREQGWVANGV